MDFYLNYLNNYEQGIIAKQQENKDLIITNDFFDFQEPHRKSSVEISFTASSTQFSEFNQINISRDIFTFYKSLIPEYLLGQNDSFLNKHMLNDKQGLNIPRCIIGNKYSFETASISHPCFFQVYANHGK